MQENVNGDLTNFLWDTLSPYGDVVVEYDELGNPLVDYVLGGIQLISQTRGADISYYLHDGQMSTRALTDETGVVTDSYSYTAFGELFNTTGTTENKYLYTGQQFDGFSGLYSLRARYYNPTSGRFQSRDVYPYNFNNPIELNRYGYVANDPVNSYDPLGLLEAALPFPTIALPSTPAMPMISNTVVLIFVVVLLTIVVILHLAKKYNRNKDSGNSRNPRGDNRGKNKATKELLRRLGNALGRALTGKDRDRIKPYIHDLEENLDNKDYVEQVLKQILDEVFPG